MTNHPAKQSNGGKRQTSKQTVFLLSLGVAVGCLFSNAKKTSDILQEF